MEIKDFRVISENMTYGVRAAALIMKDNRLLCLYHAKKNLYVVPGGAIGVGESTEEAVRREVQEELGVEIIIENLSFVAENYFKHEERDFHNIEFYYSCHLAKEYSNDDFIGDTGLEVVWLPLDDLKTYHLRPVFLKDYDLSQIDNLLHLVNRD